MRLLLDAADCFVETFTQSKTVDRCSCCQQLELQSLAVKDLEIGDVSSALIVAHCQETKCCYRMLPEDTATE